MISHNSTGEIASRLIATEPIVNEGDQGEQIWTLALFLKHMDKLPPAPQQAWQNVRN